MEWLWIMRISRHFAKRILSLRTFFYNETEGEFSKDQDGYGLAVDLHRLCWYTADLRIQYLMLTSSALFLHILHKETFYKKMSSWITTTAKLLLWDAPPPKILLNPVQHLSASISKISTCESAEQKLESKTEEVIWGQKEIVSNTMCKVMHRQPTVLMAY